MLTPMILHHCYPRARAALCTLWAPFIDQAMQRYGINTIARQAAFLGQCGWECWQLTALAEKYEPGRRYGSSERGRGMLHTTWRSNYEWTGRELGIDGWKMREEFAMPELGSLSAAVYWQRYKDVDCNLLSDQGKYLAISRHINGPKCNTHDKRMQYIARCQAALENAYGREPDGQREDTGRTIYGEQRKA